MLGFSFRLNSPMISSIPNFNCNEQLFDLVIELGKCLAAVSGGLLVYLWIRFWLDLGIKVLEEGIAPGESPFVKVV